MKLFALEGKSPAFRLAAIPVNIRYLYLGTFWLSLILITTLQCCYYKSLLYKWASYVCNIVTFCQHLEDHHVNLCLLQSLGPTLLLRLWFSHTCSFLKHQWPLQCNWAQWDTRRKGAKILCSLDWKYLLHSNKVWWFVGLFTMLSSMINLSNRTDNNGLCPNLVRKHKEKALS